MKSAYSSCSMLEQEVEYQKLWWRRRCQLNPNPTPTNVTKTQRFTGWHSRRNLHFTGIVWFRTTKTCLRGHLIQNQELSLREKVARLYCTLYILLRTPAPRCPRYPHCPPSSSYNFSPKCDSLRPGLPTNTFDVVKFPLVSYKAQVGDVFTQRQGLLCKLTQIKII